MVWLNESNSNELQSNVRVWLNQDHDHDGDDHHEDDHNDGDGWMFAPSPTSTLSTLTATGEDEEDDDEEEENAASLEGILYWRKGRKCYNSSRCSSFFWKRRYVVLDFAEGSLAAYSSRNTVSAVSTTGTVQNTTTHASTQSSAASAPSTPSKTPTKLHRSKSMHKKHPGSSNSAFNLSKKRRKSVAFQEDTTGIPSSDVETTKDQLHQQQQSSQQELAFYISASATWHVKDVANDSHCFVLEIMSPVDDDDEHAKDEESSTELISSSSGTEAELDFLVGDNPHNTTTISTEDQPQQQQHHEPTKPSLRFYFKCRHGGNEKVLWLKAFAKMNRLSADFRTKKPLIQLKHSPWKAPRFAYHYNTSSRTRTPSSAALARQSMQLEQQSQAQLLNHIQSSSSTASSEHMTPIRSNRSRTSTTTNNNATTSTKTTNTNTTREKEYRVIPQRCYPNVWMTLPELHEEMEKPSHTFYNLIHNHCRLDLPNNPSQQPIIGTLHLEVLQGLGFPKLDRTDAVVYVVSGPYAFCTEVIKDKQSPIWPSKSQRACSIPLHHGYARVYVGVFDDSSNKTTKDDFNGRVVLDVARLRPNSTYDVTLPLRLSAHVYSRRQRGAIRLRFRLEWTSVREALLSYLPKTLPRKPPNWKDFSPNTDTVVTCGSARAFRNVAITVHGTHIPGRFSFQQLRATIREINFTRKTVLGIVRNTIVELREWRNPLLSACCFLAWMHCVYQNAFSLVPAHVMLYLWILLVRNYARYGMDGPAQRGFIPPSWEELVQGLVLAPEKKNGNSSPPIEPLDMNLTSSLDDDYEVDSGGSTSQQRQLQQQKKNRVNVQTHEPRGKPLFRAMGFLDEEAKDSTGGTVATRGNVEEELNSSNYHLEFPYADGRVYPRFTVEDSLAANSKKRRKTSTKARNPHSPTKSRAQRLKQGLSKMMRKDTSGMNDYDDEEQRFATAKLIRQTGATQLMEAASGLMEVGESLGEATGLQYVVSPVVKGGQFVVSPVLKGGQSAVMGGLHYVVPPIKSGIKTGHNAIETSIRGLNNHVVSPLVVSPLHHTVDLVRRTSNEYIFHHQQQHPAIDEEVEDMDHDSLRPLDELDERSALHYRQRRDTDDSFEEHGMMMASIAEHDGESDDDYDDVSNSLLVVADDSDDSDSPRRLLQPDQDIDYDGSSSTSKSNKDSSNNKTKKRLTDDLQDVKDQMHQFTFQKFNDRPYIIRDSDSRYFGQSANPPKRQVKKDLNKLLQIGQYSHVNPVVGRVGQYAEPIVGASHSFLCAFRALFNVMTWRDPFLTFWISLLGFVLVAILFVFPWRWFLFVLGLWFVGPQNLVYRVLRQRGILPPKKSRSRRPTGREAEEMPVPTDQAVFQGHISQDQKRKPHKPVDPREVQYVVVPYSPLMYQRFYDWPPEQEYSQVYSHNHVTSDVAAGASGLPSSSLNGYFSAAVADGKKTQ